MAGDWIKLEIGFIDKREIAILAKKLGISIAEAAVSVIRVFIWFDTNTRDGNVPFLSPTDLDAVARCVTGTCSALASDEIGWLTVGDDGLSLKNWDRHNGKSAKQRLLEREKKRQQRTKTDDCPPKSPGECPDNNGTKQGTEQGPRDRDREENKYKESPPPACATAAGPAGTENTATANNPGTTSTTADDLTFLEGESPEFIRWWESYPEGSRVARRACLSIWPKILIEVQAKIRCSEQEAAIHVIQRTQLFANSPRGKEAEFRWSAETFLRDGHYDDELKSWELSDAKQRRTGGKNSRQARGKHIDSTEFADALEQAGLA